MEQEPMLEILKKLQERGSVLSEELNVRLTELYRWYDKELNLISDEMLNVLNDPNLYYNPDLNETIVPTPKTKKNSLKPEGKIEEIELSLEKLQEEEKTVDLEKGDHGTKRWPRFWLHALLGCKATKYWITDRDFEVLYYLNDVRVEVFESNENAESFEIKLHFTQNPYFSNPKLSRKFYLTKNSIASESTEIDWTCEDELEYGFGFFRFFDPEVREDKIKTKVDLDDLRMAMCIKDRIRRNPLKYVLRYHSQLRDEPVESDSEEEWEEDTKVGSRYPFSWLFGK